MMKMQTIVYILIGINVLTFLVYGIDKWKAKQGSWRISEATLLILAVSFQTPHAKAKEDIVSSRILCQR